jgi:hypothetical protein
MPTTAWSTMRQDVLRPLGLITGSTTTNISSGNANVLDTKLTKRFPVDDYFNNRWYVHLTSGTNSGDIRRVTDYAQSTGTITGGGANWGDNESGSINFELSTFHPDDVKDAYNEAREIVFPDISMVRDIETIVTGLNQYTYTLPSTIRRVDRVYRGNRRNADSGDNLLLNGDFEDWTSATSPDYWSVTGAGASMNQEAQTSNPENYAVLHGDNSLRLVVPGSTAVTLVQTYDSTLDRYTAVATQGMEANVSAWVYATVASRVSLTIDGAVQSDTHGGTGWELLKGSQILTQTDTEAAVGLSITSGSAMAVFVDEAWMTLGQSEMIDVPYSELRNWDHVPPAEGASNGGVIRFQETLPDKYRIRIVGRDLLTAASTDAGTVEIDGELLHPVYDKTRQLLCLRMAAGNPDSNWTEMARQFEASYVRAVEGDLVKIKTPPVAVPRMVF